MDKISCDVNKDLLAAYLDGICSEESKGLVEGHLKECAACRQFVGLTQERDLGKDAVKVDSLKKVKQLVNIRSWVAAALALLLVFIGHPGIRYQSLETLLFYIAMPVLMLAGALALKGDGNGSRAAGKGWVMPVLGAALVCVTLGVQAAACGMISGHIPMPLPQEEMGPFLEWVNTGIMVLSMALLVVSYLRLKGEKGLCAVSLNLAWLGMNLALACDTLLYRVEDFPALIRSFINVITILLLESAVMTALILLFFYISDKKQRQRDHNNVIV